MTSQPIKIVGMSLCDEPMTRNDTMAARFDCRFSGVTLIGCILIKRPDGSFRVIPPSFGQEKPGKGIRFDEALAEQVLTSALDMFDRFEGRVS